MIQTQSNPAMTYRFYRFCGMGVALAAVVMFAVASHAEAQPSGDTTVYHNPGKKRVHVEQCRRFSGKEGKTEMTLKEALAKGLPLCSRCPGSDTPRNDKAGSKPGTKNDGPSDDTIVYYGGKKRVHVDGCRRLTDKESKVTMTYKEALAKGLPLCSRCPGSDTPGKGTPDGKQANLPESWVNPPPDRDTPIAKRAYRAPAGAPLVAMGADGRLVYASYTDKGDRILDWSMCGYKKSEQPIPTVRVVETISPMQVEATADGKMAYPAGPDSREAIQAALDRVAAMPVGPDGFRGAVLLAKGTHYIVGSLHVPAGVVLRGAGDGEDGTVVIARTTKGGGNMIELGDPKASVEMTGEADRVRIDADYVPTGSTQVKVTDASQFKAGDMVCVRKTVNDAWIEALGVGERLRHIRAGKEGLKKRPWRPGSYQFRHIREVTKVDGNTLTLDAMLPQSFEAQHGGGEVFKVSDDAIGRHSGVESLRLVSNYDKTMKDNSKDANYMNFNSGINVAGTSDSWVRDVTVLHVSFACVRISKHTRYITVRDSKSLQPVGPVRGGKRYAFTISGGSLHLVYNCYSEDGRHDFVGGSRTMGPYAFVKCTAVRGGQSEPHHRWGTGYLFDNIVNTDGSIAAINRGDSGSGHGWAAANTVIWNSAAKGIVVFDPETTGENNFAIGFGGTHQDGHDTGNLYYANTRSGYWGTPREGAYYGYALMGNGHIESPDGPVRPQSLFIQQLIDRIGEQQAMKVLE